MLHDTHMGDRDPKLPAWRNYPDYEEDFAAWLQAQANLLRERRFDELDIPNLVEEVESVGRSEFRALESALALILLHMMKWDYQTERQGKSWRSTINAQRRKVAKLLKDNPSFKSRLKEAVAGAYDGVPDEVDEATGVPAHRLPPTCPYSWDEIMNRPHNIDPDRPWPN
jgi:hypothetical protein